MSANIVSVDEESLRKDIKNLVRRTVEETLDALAYLDFPPVHRKRLRANNAQARANCEIKRGARVAQAFPPRACRCGSWARPCANRTRYGRSPGTSRRRG